MRVQATIQQAMAGSSLMVEGSCMSHLSMHTDRRGGMGARGGYNSQASRNSTGMAMMGMHLSSTVESSIRATLGAGVGVPPGGGMLA